MIELFITYLVGALVGGTILVLWVARSIWPHQVAVRGQGAPLNH